MSSNFMPAISSVCFTSSIFSHPVINWTAEQQNIRHGTSGPFLVMIYCFIAILLDKFWLIGSMVLWRAPVGVECGRYGGTCTPLFGVGVQYPHFSDTHGIIFDGKSIIWCLLQKRKRDFYASWLSKRTSWKSVAEKCTILHRNFQKFSHTCILFLYRPLFRRKLRPCVRHVMNLLSKDNLLQWFKME